jgi:DNA polymerase-3 subunit alpha
MSQFVHLHLHTEYSLDDGLTRIKPTIAAAKQLSMQAIAITDLSNLYAVVKFYKACVSAGIKPIIGAEVWIENPIEAGDLDKFVLLAQNNEGYVHLCELLSHAVIHNKVQNKPVVSQDQLRQRHVGLIAISLSREGALSQSFINGDIGYAKQSLASYRELFSENLFLSVSRISMKGENKYIERVVPIAQEMDIGLVATNQVQFLHPEDFDLHEVRVCINQGRQIGDSRRTTTFSSQNFLRSVDQMAELFSDLPEAIENTVHIAKKCNVFLTFGTDYLPEFPGSGERTAEQAIRDISVDGLKVRLARLLELRAADEVPEFGDEAYFERLEIELSVINQMGFPGYFLIVADFIKWSRDHDIPVGPGRGSGAGSVVAWAMGITDIDPLQYGLLFERFLNPERVSMPDFDIDFCMEGRDRVIEYVSDCYGRNQVAQIITFGSMAAKAVIRDVGRVLGHSYGYVDSIAKLVPFEIGITLQKALDKEPEFQERYNDDAEAAQLINTAMKLEGLSKNVGKHAGGVVIAPSSLTDFTALFADSEEAQAVTQLDKDDLEAIGLVKFDFLGLRTLTIIDWAQKLINANPALREIEHVEVPDQPFYDAVTFDLIKKGMTVAVFQLESSGMRDLILRLQPDCFEDLIALVALYRPGPLESGMVNNFVDRKHGKQRVEYPHPLTESILAETYGVILYQEQVMQIAQVLAGYSLGGADILRRAMGKKKPEEMAKQRSIFVDGSLANNISGDDANYIFDLMEKFAGYGFNKSHSAAYALISFQTAWLKAHYPAAFMAATLSADMDHTDKVVSLIAEARKLDLDIRVPNINECDYKFLPTDAKTIVYGLGAVKGLGEAAIESIVSLRQENGAYNDLHDYCQRVDSKKVNKRAMEALVRCGGLDCLGMHRAQTLLNLPFAMEVAEQKNKDSIAGQSDLFGLAANDQVIGEMKVTSPWREARRLSEERESLGLYLSGHPFDAYRNELESISDRKQGVMCVGLKSGVVTGMIVALRVIITKRGDKMAFVSLDDGYSRIEISIFSDLYEQCKELLLKDQILIVQGDLEEDALSESYQMLALSVCNLDMLRSDMLLAIKLSVNGEMPNEFNSELANLLKPHKGGDASIELEYSKVQGVSGRIQLGEKWRVHPTQELLDQLLQLCGKNSVVCEYNQYAINEGLRYRIERRRQAYKKQSTG